MAAFKFGARSLRELNGVHIDLVNVVHLALKKSAVDFAITDGLRTAAEQAEYLRTGASTTKNSRHLTGHAVDLVACLPNGKISYATPLMLQIRDAMVAAAAELKVPLRWGGDWDGNPDTTHSLIDMPHFELPRSKRYP